MKKERIKAWFTMTKGEVEFLIDFFMCMIFVSSATVASWNFDALKTDMGLWFPIVMVLVSCLGFALSWILLTNSNEDR